MVFLSGKAGFLVTRQKCANLLHFKWKSRFSRDAPKLLILVHYNVKSRFSRDAPKKCKFVAFLSGKAGFLVTRQNRLNLMHYYVKMQVFS